MNKLTLIAVLILFGILLSLASAMPTAQAPASAAAQGEGTLLVGYGLVAGLSGQGDSDLGTIRQIVSTWSHSNHLDAAPGKIENRDFALVVVTARVRSGGHNGDKLDITVSSLADAKTLRGGTLLLTHLVGPDKKVYAEACGGLNQTPNSPTVGALPSGATLLQDASF